MLQCYNFKLSPEEGKIRALTGKELAEDRVGLLIQSLVIFSEIISSFFPRNSCQRVEDFTYESKVFYSIL